MKKEVAFMYIERLGKILSNYSIIGAFLLPISLVSIFFYIAYYVVLIAIVIFTLGLIFVTHPGFASWFDFSNFEVINQVLIMITPYIAATTAGLSFTSVGCLCFGLRGKKCIWRLVINSLIGAISLAVFLFITFGGA